LQIHKEIGYLGGTATQLNNLGNIYKIQNKQDLALKYFKEALEIFKEIGYNEGVKITTNNIKELEDADK
jgi:tetratricopeptide (TPR) repeat protein